MNLFFKEEILVRKKRQYLADIDQENTNDPFRRIKESSSSGGTNVLAIVGAVVGVVVGLIIVYVIIRKILNRRKQTKGGFNQSHGMPKTQLTKEEVGKTMNIIMGATQETSSPKCGYKLPQKNCSRMGDPDNVKFGKDSGREDSGVENDVFVPDNPEDYHHHHNNNNPQQQKQRNSKSRRKMSASNREIATLEKVKNEKFCNENVNGRSQRQERKSRNMRDSKEFFTPYHKQQSLPVYDDVANEESRKSKRRGDSNKRYSQRIARATNEQPRDKKRRRTIAEDGLGAGRTTSVLKNSNGAPRSGRYHAEIEQFAMNARKERSKRASQAREDQVNAISKQRDFVPSSR